MEQYNQHPGAAGRLVNIRHWRFKPNSIGLIINAKTYEGFEITGVSTSEYVNQEKFEHRQIRYKNYDENNELIYFVYHNCKLYYFFCSQLDYIN